VLASTLTPSNTTRTALARPFRIAGAAVLAVAAVRAFDPLHRHVPLCPFHAATGWQCPLCGGLRALDELTRAHPVAALHDNALVVAGIALAVLLWLDLLVRRGAGRTARRWPRTATAVLIGLAVGFTVLRNLPFAASLRP
jgi:hypothetical protein